MTEFVTSGVITDGVLKIRNRRALEDWAFNRRDGEYLVTITRAHATRSDLQNRYYFGVVLKLLSDRTGYTVDELHDWAKARYLPKHLAITDGNGVIKDDFIIGGTTTTLNKNEFSEYVEQIRQFAAEELDVNIPDPDPNWRQAA